MLTDSRGHSRTKVTNTQGIACFEVYETVQIVLDRAIGVFELGNICAEKLQTFVRICEF